jgi:arylformamidase
MAFHDLTMPLGPATPVFPGDPAPSFSRWEPARPWQVTMYTVGSHVGTHMDAPRHLLPDGQTIDGFGPDRWIGETVVITAAGLPEDAPIPATVLTTDPTALLKGRFALLATGWDALADDPAYFRHPWLSPELASALLDAGVALVGIDAPNVDSSVSGSNVVHHILLGAGIPIVENLRGLTALPALVPLGACFAPLRIIDGDGSPVRAVAWDLPSS